MSMARLLAGAALALLATAAIADTVKLVGTGSAAAADTAATGRKLTVISSGGGLATIAIRTEPHVNFVCRPQAASTTCYAFVKPGTRIAVEPTRIDPGGDGATTPAPTQWGADCVGQNTASCVVTMTANRTVSVDWSVAP